MGELSRALAELKRAEQEVLQDRKAPPPGQPAAGPDAATARRALEQRKAAPSVVRGQGAIRAGVAKGGDLVKRRVFMPKPKPAPGRVNRPVEYDPDQAFEDPTIISLEGLDYDAAAEQVVQTRIKAAELRDAQREDASLEEMSAAQLARRADRAPAAAIGGKTEHEAWHQRRDAVVKAPEAKPAASRLSRFGGGRIREAIVLSEILGRPVGER